MTFRKVDGLVIYVTFNEIHFDSLFIKLLSRKVIGIEMRDSVRFSLVKIPILSRSNR
jgi:hypothetical protein